MMCIAFQAKLMYNMNKKVDVRHADLLSVPTFTSASTVPCESFSSIPGEDRPRNDPQALFALTLFPAFCVQANSSVNLAPSSTAFVMAVIFDVSPMRITPARRLLRK